jgi:hypothetical protein
MELQESCFEVGSVFWLTSLQVRSLNSPNGIDDPSFSFTSIPSPVSIKIYDIHGEYKVSTNCD